MATTAPPRDTYVESVNFVSGAVGAFLYGIHFILALIAFRELYRVRRWALGLYVFALLAAGTTLMAELTQYTMDMFLEYGSLSPDNISNNYLVVAKPAELKIVGFAFVAINALSSGFLVARYATQRRSLLAAVPALLLFAVSTVFSLLNAFHVVVATSPFGMSRAVPYATVYVSLASALHLVIVLLSAVQPPSKAWTWPTFVLDSTALLAISTIAFVASYAAGNAIFNVFFAAQAYVMCIVPVAVVLRSTGVCRDPDSANSSASGVPAGGILVVSEKEVWHGSGSTSLPRGKRTLGDNTEVLSLDTDRDSLSSVERHQEHRMSVEHEV